MQTNDLNILSNGRFFSLLIFVAVLLLLLTASRASLEPIRSFGSNDNNDVTKFVFSPDGNTVASAAEDKIRLWDVSSAQERASFASRSGEAITGLAFSPDGRVLAGIVGHTKISIWDLASGSQQRIFSSRNTVVSDIAFSPDRTMIASTGKNDRRIKLWDIKSGQERLTLVNRSDAAVTGLIFSPVGMTLATTDADANIILWDPVSGEVKQTLEGHHGLIKALAFNPDGTMLASGGLDAQIKLWDVTTGQEQYTLPGYFDYVATDLAFSPDNHLLVSTGEDPSLTLWNVTTGELGQTFVGHGDLIADVAFSSNQRTLASVANDGELIIWDLKSGNEHSVHYIPTPSVNNALGNWHRDSGNSTRKTSEPPALTTPAVLATARTSNEDSRTFTQIAATNQLSSVRRRPSPRAWGGITALAISPNGKLFSSAGKDGSVRLWDSTGRELLAIEGHHGMAVTGVSFDANGQRLFSVGRDSATRSWDVSTGKPGQTFFALEHALRAIAVSNNGQFFATAGEETRIMLWDAKTGKLTRILTGRGDSGHRDFVNGLAFSQNGKLLASAGADGRIVIWEIPTGRPLRTLLGHAGEVNTIVFSVDNNFLVSGGADSTVKVWDAATGRQIHNLAGHQAPVRSVAISPNKKIVVSGGEDSKILTWDIATGNLLNTITGNTNFINALVFEPNGQLLAGDEDDRITTWNAETKEKLRTTEPTKEPIKPLIGPQASGSAEFPIEKSPALSSLAPSRISQTATRSAHVALPKIFSSLVDWLLPTAIAAPLPDPNQGPGGPILVIDSASSAFGKYYAEILRNEGFNAFAVADITTVTPTTLAAYDVVILAGMPLSATQATMFSNWVNAGGNLIAMRPDSDLAGLLGISSTGSTLSEGYLLVDTSTAPGNGIVDQTIQFHGTADLYTLSGATEIATLYSDATTATSSPAVTLHSVGSNGGQAAAFAYDLATSIVYTRQGNPAWAAQERDGYSPIRSDDKYYGDATGDPQPDWVDLNKVAIPQADEQQRLLANLISEMNLNKEPLPRFWYFPRGEKAVVIMTGDDHANNGTAGRFDQFIARSPAGCNVDNWECVRGTSYIFPNTPLTDAQAAGYAAQGFEVGLHINTNCADFTPAQLENFYTQQISVFTSNFPSVPPLSTQRHHCIAWSDWITGAKVQLNHGIRLDTSYYFWPPGWVFDRPGFFTGSGMPMRFSDLDGTLIDVYLAATQMTDESGQSYPFTIDALLDRALGEEGYYGAFTINAHTDVAQIPEADAVLDSALSRGVPIITSQQMLDWLDARNSSSFGAIGWDGNALTFTVTAGAGANGLQAFVPRNSEAGVSNSITRNGSAVSFTTEVIKGTEYAFFPATAGTYVTTYTADTVPPTITSRSPTNGATDISLGTTVTATFSEAMNPATITTSSFELRDASNALVPATITYIASTRTAKLTPDAPLTPSTVYTATVKGGTTDPRVKDLSGNALAANSSWSFTTEAGPMCPCSAWSNSTTPANPSVADPNAVELGIKFQTDLDGLITGIRFYKGSGNTGTHVGNLWTSTGQLLATATFTNETASGWQQVEFGTPVPITANTVYVASYHAPNGNYAGDNSFFANSGVDNEPLHLLQNGVSGGNGVYQYGPGGFPTDTYKSSNYWVDVVFTTDTGPDTTPPTVTATLPTDGASEVGVGTTVTATFSEAMEPATINTSTFELRDVNNTLVPATVTYDAANNVATLTPSSALADSTTYSTTVKSGANGVKDLAGNALATDSTWSFTTESADTTPPTVMDISPTDGASDVSVGTTVTATFSEAMDPATITTSTFELRDDTNALVAATVAYDAATDTATLAPDSVLANSMTYTATVKGGTGGGKDLAGNALTADSIWSFTTVTADMTPPTVTSTTPADGALDVGVGTAVTASFSEAMDGASIDSTNFELRDDTNALVSAAVTYDVATDTATLTPASSLTNSATYTATVRGEADGVKDLAGNALAVDEIWSFTTAAPGTCPCTIWDETTTPALLADPDTSAVEVGVKFRTDVDGLITGIRFYKSGTNTGTHVGNLWSSDGQLLASATFTNEAASGWQQVDFASPVAITANTIYVASYHTDVGHYSVNENYFAASGVDNGPFHALQDGESGGNGVYLYGGGGFPTNTFRSSNYWVDVVFTE